MGSLWQRDTVLGSCIERGVNTITTMTASQDQWQLEVYLHALGLMKKHNLESVVDIGCGSAYKLITDLGDYKTIGLELPENVRLLQKQYPARKWQVSDFSTRHDISADVVICSDIIEHLVDPDELIEFIKGIPFKYLILSTPNRELLYRPWKRGF
jgi:2-polyprenyl-3-methyl-5-hydroxy-6-metoxy-1,4-benzoquinol methylase